MRKMTVLGASALLVAGLMGTPAAAFAAPVAGAPVAATPSGEQTCPKDGKVDVDTKTTTLEVTAEEGYLITGYCVKAGSKQNGNGPVFVPVNPPSATVTIEHPSGKEISHYTLITVKAEPTPEPSPSVPGEEPSEEPSPEPSVPGEEPTEPGTEPSEPGTEPSEPGTEPTEPGTEPTEPGAAPAEPGTEPTEPGAAPADGSVEEVDAESTPAPSAEADRSGVLAATGASTAIGFALIALALVGGGATLIVLRRKGVLGS